MAITKTVKILQIRIYPAADSTAEDSSNAKWPSLQLIKEVTLDDTEDAELPVSTHVRSVLNRYNLDDSAYDFSNEDTLTKAVLGAIWT
jgi:hypothetical protein